MIPSLHVYQLSSQVDDGWCEGTLKGTGIRGMFPDNFVELIQPQKQQPPLPQVEPPKIRGRASTGGGACH